MIYESVNIIIIIIIIIKRCLGKDPMHISFVSINSQSAVMSKLDFTHTIN